MKLFLVRVKAPEGDKVFTVRSENFFQAKKELKRKMGDKVAYVNWMDTKIGEVAERELKKETA